MQIWRPRNSSHVPSSARAAITKYYGLSDLNNGYLFLTVLEAGSPRSRSRKIWFLTRPIPWLAEGHPLTVSLRGRKRESSGPFSSFIQTLIPSVRLHLNLIASQWPNLQTPSRWGRDRQHTNFWRGVNIQSVALRDLGKSPHFSEARCPHVQNEKTVSNLR